MFLRAQPVSCDEWLARQCRLVLTLDSLSLLFSVKKSARRAQTTSAPCCHTVGVGGIGSDRPASH